MTLEERALDAARAGWSLTEITFDGHTSVMAINPTNSKEVWYYSPQKDKWQNEEKTVDTIPLCKHEIKEGSDA